MNLHKFFHGDEIFSCPCVLDSKDGVLSRITYMPANDTVAALAVGVRVSPDLAVSPKPKFGNHKYRMPAASRARRQTIVGPY